jgi:hypothetical protein
LAAPLLVVVLSGLMWLERGPGAACAVMGVGFLAIVAWHLRQLQKLTQWAAGPIDSQGPEGRGMWALAYTALYRRVRLRSARQRDLRLALEDSSAVRRRFLKALSCSTPAIASSGPIRGRRRTSELTCARSWRADRQPVRQPAFVRYDGGRCDQWYFNRCARHIDALGAGRTVRGRERRS